MSSPLIDSIKKQELERSITFILRIDGVENSFITKAKINHKIPSIRQNIIQKLEQIARVYITPTRINLTTTSPALPNFEEKITDVFDVIDNTSNLRIIVKFEKYNSQDLKKIVNDHDISHVIEISLVEDASNSKHDDLNTGDIACATVYPKNIENIYKVIEDIILDISMYHTVITPHLSDNAKVPASFSYLKVSYAEKLKLKSENWDVNRHKGYISLAGYFRNKDNFEYGKYINCWLEIFEEAKKEYPDSFIERTVSIDEQLKRHMYYKQLPIKRIKTTYNQLPSGTYILIQIFKRPNQTKKRREILTFFKGSNWRKGKINILPFDKIATLSRYSEWITIFQIRKP